MKQKTRVTGGKKVASLNASEGVAHNCSTKGKKRRRRWREQAEELRRWRSLPKKRVTLYLDADVLFWFREHGRGYQRGINRALRRVMMEAEKKARE